MALQPPIAAPRADHELGALRVDARRAAAAENLRRVKYQAIKRLKMETERQALEDATEEGEAETETEAEEEEEQEEQEEEVEHRRDGRDIIGLPRLAAPAAAVRTKDKLRESMLEYTRRMAQYKNWRELRLQGSCVTATAAAAAVGEQRNDERPVAGGGGGGGGGRAMPAAEERRPRRRAAAAAAAVAGTSPGKESVAVAATATGVADLTVVDASPRDGTKARRSLADALSEMLKSAAAAIKIDGKSLNRPSPQRQPPSPPSQTSRVTFDGAEPPRLQHHEREMSDEGTLPVDIGYRRFVAARAASPTRVAARQRPANAPRASADRSPSRDGATSVAAAAAAAPPNSSAASAGESDEDDGEYEGDIFEVVSTDGGAASLKRLLVLAAAAAAATGAGSSEAFEGGRRPVRARRMKLPRPLLGSIVEDESEENDRATAAAAAAAAARTTGRALTFPAMLAAVPEAVARDDVAQAEAAWRRDRRRSILLRLVNASNAAPHEVSKYMTSYARKKLLKLPALKATAERRR